MVEKGFSREESYAIVQEMAMRVWKREGSLRELCEKHPVMAQKISKKEFDEIFDLGRYLKNIDYIYKKVGLE